MTPYKLVLDYGRWAEAEQRVDRYLARYPDRVVEVYFRDREGLKLAYRAEVGSWR